MVMISQDSQMRIKEVAMVGKRQLSHWNQVCWLLISCTCFYSVCSLIIVLYNLGVICLDDTHVWSGCKKEVEEVAYHLSRTVVSLALSAGDYAAILFLVFPMHLIHLFTNDNTILCRTHSTICMLGHSN